LPNVSLLTPADENECRQALYTAFMQNHPVAVRYPRGAGAGVQVQAAMTEIPFGVGEIRRESRRTAAQPGKRIAILAFGTLLYPALAAAERIDATVANMRFAKPLDVALVTDLARRHDAIVTVEEGTVMGGAGSAVLEALAEARIDVPVLVLGLPDTFIEHGDPAKLLAQCGLDAAGIEQSIQRRFGAPPALLRTAVGQ
jgi:1-deoxy-D-xylulose-5-phosphate synthase